MEYQLVRTPTKATTCIQDPASHNCQPQPVQDALSKQQTTKKIQTQSSADRITIFYSPAHQRKKENSPPPTREQAQVTPYMKLTQTTEPTL